MVATNATFLKILGANLDNETEPFVSLKLWKGQSGVSYGTPQRPFRHVMLSLVLHPYTEFTQQSDTEPESVLLIKIDSHSPNHITAIIDLSNLNLTANTTGVIYADIQTGGRAIPTTVVSDLTARTQTFLDCILTTLNFPTLSSVPQFSIFEVLHDGTVRIPVRIWMGPGVCRRKSKIIPE